MTKPQTFVVVACDTHGQEVSVVRSGLTLPNATTIGGYLNNRPDRPAAIAYYIVKAEGPAFVIDRRTK